MPVRVRPAGLAWGDPIVIGAAAGALGLAAGLALPTARQAMASAVLAIIMGAIAAGDIRAFRVPDALNLAAGAAGAGAAWLGMGAGASERLPSLGAAALGALLCGGALLALREAFFRLRGADGLGLGDVKLAAAAGAWLGWRLFPFAVLFAAFGALVFVALWTAARGPWPRTQRIPFALYLAPAIWIVWYMAQLVALS